MDKKIDLISLAASEPKKAFYEPLIFPGLQFNPFINNKTTVLVFVSGKLIITGVKSEDRYDETKTFMRKLLLKFR